jgi:outer membrane protein
MTMGFRRPLEEDRGLISLKLPIRRAENRMQVVESAFKQELEGLLLQVENTYWDLVLAKNLLLVRKQSYDLAEELRELTRNQVDVGVQPPIALTQAKAGVAARAEAVIVSEGLIHDLEEALITYIDMPLHDRSILKDLELELPEMEKIKLAPVETLVESAVDRRPEILSARQAVEIQKIEKQLVADRRKQQVDLIGSLRNPGTAGDISSATDQVMDKHFYSWMLGISWELGKRRKEDLDYSIAEIELIKTMLTLESTMEMVTAQIRGAYRQVDIALKRIESTTSARVLAEEQLEAERERFKLGLATPYDLLLVENDLSNARSSEVSALVDLQKSLASLAFSRGVLAESWEVDY